MVRTSKSKMRNPEMKSKSLSRAELRVYNLAIKGLSRSEIAEEISKTRSTVNFHFDSVLKKLSVSSHVKLIAKHYLGGNNA